MKLINRNILPFRCPVLICCCLFLLFTHSSLQSQDPQFSQFYAAPLYLNPAFTGNTIKKRFILNYRNQWPSVSKSFISYAFSYDYNFQKSNSGMGLMLIHDKAGTNGLRFTNAGGSYSYNIPLSQKHFVRTGIRASYTIRDYDPSSLLFADQVITGASATSDPNLVDVISYFDFSSGLVFYSNKYWIGGAIHHLNQPNQSLTGEKTQLPRKTTVHMGYQVPIKKDIKNKVLSSAIITMQYKAQKEWDQVDIGAYFDYEPLIVGIWYRGIPWLKAYQPGYSNNDAIVLMLGFDMEGYHIGYSYDITISRLVTHTGGAHEISIVYEYPNPKKIKKKSVFIIPCSKF